MNNEYNKKIIIYDKCNQIWICCNNNYNYLKINIKY